MKTLCASFLILIVSLGLGACTTPAPLETGYPRTYQQKMQAAHHWEVLATDVAQRLGAALSTQDPSGGKQILNVKGAKCCTVFNWAFHDFLITHLLEQGFGVSSDPNVGLPVEYQVQVVTHKDRCIRRPKVDCVTGLTSEVVVTTSVMSGDRYLVRMSDVYYISDNNSDQYLAQVAPPTRLMEVVGQ
ncbi:MAG: hypothetical protein V2J55_22590 [Candidatus Competibacteraceae bacterium]|nr:hypothetical protein [Candidatus Competibacteraceae bacterium]